ncbi:glycosyl transferase family 2 [Pokkaliibacter plantistimulans]|uniref:Glycosyl transferase family 2 n=1 Tax=Proteobacteria bacterium 228 TaxID=2083153 RepID=A0A2S5KS82_9PROT|nr:glycosyltransferase family 2 protein [Pokkaliibacter plantistimulans]PPC77704.1 glycosyl transferase family 2 [Pokkaliibacter plantistimulans]
MPEFIFWLSLLIPFYAYVGFPVLLAMLARARTGDTPPQPAEPLSVSIILAAYNEAATIRQKLESVLQQDYQAQKLQIIVASDGSSDDTVALARSVDDPRILVLDLPRAGKHATLNSAISHASEDILVFTDVDNQWRPDTLRHLLAPFSDPEVGATCGNALIIKQGQALSQGDGMYRHYEAWIRRSANALGCTLSADGALQALRRNLFQTIPLDVNDDFFLITCPAVQGKKSIYVDAAQVYTEGTDKAANQLRRRIRITLGGLQSLAYRKQLLNPLRYGTYALVLISHKVIRRFAPLSLLPLLISSCLLWQQNLFYALLCVAQLLAYGIALTGLLLPATRLPRVFRIAGFVVLSLYGMAAGLVQFLCGKRLKPWNPQESR